MQTGTQPNTVGTRVCATELSVSETMLIAECELVGADHYVFYSSCTQCCNAAKYLCEVDFCLQNLSFHPSHNNCQENCLASQYVQYLYDNSAN